MRIAAATAPDIARGTSTEAGFTVGEVTLGGTIGLVVFAGIIVAGIIGAVLYVVFRPWLAWAGRSRGPVFGVVLLAVASATSDVLNPDNFDFIVLRNAPLDVALIVVVFLGFGVVLDVAYRVLDARLPEPTGRPRPLHVLVVLLGVTVGAPLTLVVLFTSNACACDPPLVASLFTVLAGFGTLLWWRGGAQPRDDRFGVLGPVAGFLGLAGATGFGLLRAISDAIAVIA